MKLPDRSGRMIENGMNLWYVYKNGFNHTYSLFHMRVSHVGWDYFDLTDPLGHISDVTIRNDNLDFVYFTKEDAEKYIEDRLKQDLKDEEEKDKKKSYIKKE